MGAVAGDDGGWAPIEGGAPPPSAGYPPPPPPPAPPYAGYPPPPTAGPYAGYPPPPWAPPALAKAGDARTGPLPLHPMSVGDILDGAFKLFKANAATLVLIVAAITVPLQLLTAFLVRSQVSPGILNVLRDPSLAEAQANRSPLAGFGTTGVTLLLGAFATPFIAGAVSRVVAASYLGQRVEAGEALRYAARRFPALLGAALLVHLIEAGAALACLVPGVLIMPMFTVVAPAIAIERLGPMQAIRRSWRLVRPRYGPVLGICLLTAVISWLLSNVIGAAPSTVAVLFGGNYAWLLIAAGGIGAELVAAPIVVIVATLVYFDARIRWEGFDLQLMAGDLDRP
jgi:hypothetical protein